MPFIELSTSIDKTAQRSIIEDVIVGFPVPVFGSPPKDFQPLAQVVSQGTCAVFTGYSAWNDHPILVVVGMGTSLLIWLAKPAGSVLRRSLAERLARKLGTDFKARDEQ